MGLIFKKVDPFTKVSMAFRISNEAYNTPYTVNYTKDRIPEHDLLLAVLYRALLDSIGMVMSGRGRYRAARVPQYVRDDAKAWIDDSEEENPFSFRAICFTLGFDPDGLKKAIDLEWSMQ